MCSSGCSELLYMIYILYCEWNISGLYMVYAAYCTVLKIQGLYTVYSIPCITFRGGQHCMYVYNTLCERTQHASYHITSRPMNLLGYCFLSTDLLHIKSQTENLKQINKHNQNILHLKRPTTCASPPPTNPPKLIP